MSGTTIKLDRDYFTAEVTEAFLYDLEIACKTMEAVEFAKLFIKFDLSFVEDYKEVVGTILDRMESWNNPKKGAELLDVKPFDSKCMFCKIGKTVKSYEWTYQNTKEKYFKNIRHYQSIAFYLDFDEDRLIEFGICNSFLDKEEINNLNSL